MEEKDVYLKHFYDSITLCKVIDLNKRISLCDIGTGAGFPGIVLKIVFPSLSIVLIDALKKRINFLNIVIKELGLKDIEAYHKRGEDYARINREKFDVVTSRAVSSLDVLSEICLPLCKVNGFFIAMKGNCDEEITSSKTIISKLNSEIKEIKRFVLPIEESNRTLVVIEKRKVSSKVYPRNFNKIKK